MASMTESPTQGHFPDNASNETNPTGSARPFGPGHQARVDSVRSEGSRRSVQFQNEIPVEPRRFISRERRIYTTDSSDPNWIEQYVLSLDGGGVRGYSTLLILKKLMQLIEQEEKAEAVPGDEDSTGPVESSYHPLRPPAPSENGGTPKSPRTLDNFLPCHYFDYMVGTSTGGLIAILLGRLRMSVDEAIDVYVNLAGEIFGKPRLWSMRGPLLFPRGRYSAQRLERVVKKVVHAQNASTGVQRDRDGTQRVSFSVFSQEPTLNSEPMMCRTVCVAYTNAEANRDHPFLFRSYEHIPTGAYLERNTGPAHAIPIWKVARATTAAFSYFKPMEIDGYEFIDGGFGCNNPSWEAWNELQIMHNAPPIGMFLSIGTGSLRERRFPTLSWATAIAAIFQGLHAAVRLVTNVENAHEIMAGTANQGGQQKFPYFRYSVIRDIGNIKLDEWRQPRWTNRPSTQERIERLTEEYLQEPTHENSNITVEDELRGIAKALVKSRRARSQTPRWEIVALGTRYRCCVPGCVSPQKVRQTADELREHIFAKHKDIAEADLDGWICKGRIDMQNPT